MSAVHGRGLGQYIPYLSVSGVVSGVWQGVPCLAQRGVSWVGLRLKIRGENCVERLRVKKRLCVERLRLRRDFVWRDFVFRRDFVWRDFVREETSWKRLRVERLRTRDSVQGET